MQQSPRDFPVYQAALDLTKDVYEVSRDFIRFELFGLSRGMCRSSFFIAVGIADSRESAETPGYALAKARETLGETAAMIKLGSLLGYVNVDDRYRLIKRVDTVAEQLNALWEFSKN